MSVARRVVELVSALRKSDVRVGRGELEDALRALDLVGVEAFSSRENLRGVLACTLLKNDVDKDAFDRAFAACFDGLPISPGGALRQAPGDVARCALLEAAAQLSGGAVDFSAEVARALAAGDEAGLVATLRRVLDELDLVGLASPLQAGWYTNRLLVRAGVDDVFAAARAAFLPDGVADARRELDELQELVRRAARRVIDNEQQKQSGRAAWPSTWDRDLRALDERGVAEARALLSKLAQRLRARILRRRKHARRGRLDARRTLRQSMATDGIPFRVALRRRRVEKPALLLLCDVSDSVRASALFLLELCAVLADLFQSTRAFVFVDRLAEVTELLAAGGAAAVAASDAVRQGGNSDYGRALGDLVPVLPSVTHKTVVVVLGDGRSNYRDPGLAVAASLRQRAKSVVWLVPEDRGTWGFGDSVLPRYARHADAMLPALTLRDLARAIDRVLR